MYVKSPGESFETSRSRPTFIILHISDVHENVQFLACLDCLSDMQLLFCDIICFHDISKETLQREAIYSCNVDCVSLAVSVCPMKRHIYLFLSSHMSVRQTLLFPRGVSGV